MPKFATGTPTTNQDYLKWIKEACDALDIPYNIALSLIDQESANGTAKDTWSFNSAGAYGLTQITKYAVGDLTDGTVVAKKFKKIAQKTKFWNDAITYKLNRTHGMSQDEIDRASDTVFVAE